MAIFHSKTILLAPLDWGLGHATRCVPIVEKLQALNCNVIIAAEKSTLKILTEAFSGIQTIPLFGYQVRYSRNKSFFMLKLLFQLPKTILNIRKEHNWLKKIVKQYKIDAIISDNRFGLYHKSVPCVYITHQLCIQTGNKWLNQLVQNIHLKIIKRYTHCWVPDFLDKDINIAGVLSHPNKIPPIVKYIGGLSRFKTNISTTKLYDIVAVISGPEPQRTIFENKLLDQLKLFKGKSLLVRGLPNGMADETTQIQYDNLTIINHLGIQDLNLAMLQADWVIARSGYTTIMDLIKLQQRAILIPTPGQTEQEYLADYLYQKHFFYTVSQYNFNLNSAIKSANLFHSSIPAVDMNLYKQVVAEFVESL